MIAVVCFNPPSGVLSHGVAADELERAILRESEQYWRQGSFDSAIDYYDQPVSRSLYPWSALKGRLLILPLLDPMLSFVLLVEPREAASQYLVRNERSSRVVAVEPGAQPWDLYAHHVVDRAIAWEVASRFYANGDTPPAPHGCEWLPEGVVSFPGE